MGHGQQPQRHPPARPPVPPARLLSSRRLTLQECAEPQATLAHMSQPASSVGDLGPSESRTAMNCPMRSCTAREVRRCPALELHSRHHKANQSRRVAKGDGAARGGRATLFIMRSRTLTPSSASAICCSIHARFCFGAASPPPPTSPPPPPPRAPLRSLISVLAVSSAVMNWCSWPKNGLASCNAVAWL